MSDRVTVALARCAGYSAGVESAVAGLLKALGGIERFVARGQSVLIKPNLLTDRKPEDAVTTHPEVVRALIRIVRRAGASPSVGDSPASARKLERVWETTGFKALCREENVPLVNLEKAGSSVFSSDGCTFSIARPALDADVIISVPKVKTHVLTTLTAGVKNLYGLVPGYQKTQLHKAHPRPSDFGRLMAEICRHVRPALTVADAVVGMEGDGPSGGTPAPLGFLAASADPMALDLTLCRILRIPPASVPYLAALGRAADEAAGVEVCGATIEEVSPASFRVPGTMGARLIPKPLVRLMAPLIWIRPSFTEACIACGQCVKTCPVSALSLEGRSRPLLNTRRCIGCCCCHEVCPVRAIVMTQSPLINFVRRGKML